MAIFVDSIGIGNRMVTRWDLRPLVAVLDIGTVARCEEGP